jgi:hypothetical protein
MVVTEEQRREAHAFYKEGLDILNESGVPFLLGGAFAMFHYTGIYRDTKDLDIFCKPSDYPKILKFFADKGYRTDLYDVRWLAKIYKGDYFIDIIFDTVNNICRVDDSWLLYATEARFVGVDVKLLSPEELVFCKIYVQNRERYDGADVNHVLLKTGKDFDWKRLLVQFVYPSEYHDIIPKWLFDELMRRAYEQYDLPPAFEKVCRGPMIDQTQYEVDIKEWNYKTYTIKTV